MVPESLHQKELIRIHYLWNDAKRELREKSRQVADMEMMHYEALESQSRMHREQVRSLQSIIAQLKDKNHVHEAEIAALQGEVDEVSEDRTRLKVGLSKAKEEIEMHRSQMSVALRYNETQGTELQVLCERVKDLEAEKRQQMDRHIAEQEAMQERVEERNEQIHMLRAKLHKSDESMRVFQSKQTDSDIRATTLEKQVLRQQDAQVRLEVELKEAYDKLQQMTETMDKDKDLRSEVEEYKRDNGRLLEMLSTTPAFEDFLSYYSGEAVTYAPQGVLDVPDSVRSASEKRLSRMYHLQDDRVVHARREHMHWVPADAFRLSNDFRRKNLPHFPEAFFGDLLMGLNQVWHQREARKLRRVKATYESKLKAAKRVAAAATPHEAVVAEQSVGRLKALLRKANKRLWSAKRAATSEEAEELMATMMRTIDGMAAKMAEIQQENDALRARIEARNRPSAAQQSSFLDGASSVGMLAMRVTDQTCSKIGELTNDYRQDLVGTAADSEALSVHQTYLERLDRATAFYRSQMRKLTSGIMQSADETTVGGSFDPHAAASSPSRPTWLDEVDVDSSSSSSEDET